MKKSLPMLAALKIATSNKANIQLDSLNNETLNMLLDCGFGPIVFNHLKNTPQFSKSPYYSALFSADLTAQILIGNYIDAIEELFTFNPELSKQTTLLKGISMCMQYYPKAHMRIMGDIDLLTSKATQPIIEHALLELGYHPKSKNPAAFYESHHHSMPLFHPQKKTWIEIHTGLFSEPASVVNDSLFTFDNIQQQTAELNFKGKPTNSMNKEMQLIYICSHWAVEPNWIKSMIQFFDMLLIINNSKSELNWKKILKLTANSSATAHLYLILSIFKDNQLISIPSNIIEQLSKNQKVINRLNLWVLHKIIHLYIFQGKIYSKPLAVNNIDILWQTLLGTNHSPLIKTLVLLPWNLLFPPNNNRRFNLLFQLKRIASAFK